MFAVLFKKGSIAQLVQSICLTSRGSAVRTRVLPLPNKGFRVFFWSPCSFACGLHVIFHLYFDKSEMDLKIITFEDEALKELQAGVIAEVK